MSEEEAKAMVISIRAPTRGATVCEDCKNYDGKDFNPRSHEGSDKDGEIISGYPDKFQSALPRGERQSSQYLSLLHIGISIRAPTRGATNDSGIYVVYIKFQSALPRGERPLPALLPDREHHFNPRSHEGSDTKVMFWKL